jgi:hypothetical protein
MEGDVLPTAISGDCRTFINLTSFVIKRIHSVVLDGPVTAAYSSGMKNIWRNLYLRT